MKKLFFLALIMIAVLGACEDRDDKISAVNIRIKNDASFTFNSVQVDGTENPYENVGAGDFSGYQEFETAYQTAALTIEADSTNYNFQPADSLLTDSLNIGFYTYELNISEAGEVSLNFKVD